MITSSDLVQPTKNTGYVWAYGTCNTIMWAYSGLSGFIPKKPTLYNWCRIGFTGVISHLQQGGRATRYQCGVDESNPPATPHACHVSKVSKIVALGPS